MFVGAGGKPLFKRAILHDGSALASWAMVSDPLRYAYDVADAVNCSVRRSTSTHRSDHPQRDQSSPAAKYDLHVRLLECLKRVPTELLGVVVGALSLRPPRYRSAFGPVLDGRSAVPHEPSYLMARSASVAPVFEASAILVGVTADDSASAGDYDRQYNDDDGLSAVEDAAFRRRLLRTYVQNVYRYHRQKIYDVLAYHYTDWEHPIHQQGYHLSNAYRYTLSHVLSAITLSNLNRFLNFFHLWKAYEICYKIY